MFTPNFGEDETNLTHIFHMGWFNHQAVLIYLKIKIDGRAIPNGSL